jgi:hypothetical protein
MVCLGNICINTLQKGAKDADDNDNDDDDDDDNNNNNKPLSSPTDFSLRTNFSSFATSVQTL